MCSFDPVRHVPRRPGLGSPFLPTEGGRLMKPATLSSIKHVVRDAGERHSAAAWLSCSAIWRRTSSMSNSRTWPIRSSRADRGRAPGWE